MNKVSFSSSTQVCSIVEEAPVNEQTGGAIRKHSPVSTYVKEGGIAECGRKNHGCKSGETQGLVGKVAKVASLFRSLLSPAKEKVPDLNDQEAVYSYINEVTRNPLSRKLLLEYASDEVRAGVVECEGRYRFNIRIHEGRDNLKGYYKLAETDPEMYKILLEPVHNLLPD